MSRKVNRKRDIQTTLNMSRDEDLLIREVMVKLKFNSRIDTIMYCINKVHNELYPIDDMMNYNDTNYDWFDDPGDHEYDG